MASLVPLPGCGGVVFYCVRCCVCCLCGGGVRFGALCTNASSSYMMQQCSCLLFQKKSLNAKGLLSDKFDLYSAFALSEKKFLNRFMHPYKHMVPGLADAYASSCAGKGTQDIPI